MVATGKKKPAGNDGLGRALQRRRQRDRAVSVAAANATAVGSGVHVRPPPSDAALQSILDASDFEEMMANVARRDTHTVAHGQVLAPPTVVVAPVAGRARAAAAAAAQARAVEFDATLLRIPRRPAWAAETSREELEKRESEAFLAWRRATAKVEEDLAAAAGFGGALLTPFEKNLHVWRQLWRVVERSDVVVQIVDARDPLLFYCADLYRYAVDEMHRTHVLLVNKADLLTPEMITRWEAYFRGQQLSAYFFSAFKASVNEQTHDARVLGAAELIVKLHQFQHTAPITKADQRVTVGFIGYPNVGKSSTINILLETAAAAEAAMLEAEEAGSLDRGGGAGGRGGAGGWPDDRPPPAPSPAAPNPLAGIAVGTVASTMNGFSSMAIKRVGVSATPGKTKHFQTLVLSDHLMLCDCPGLVFPNFSASKSELICAGVLSIDTMRGDAVSPVAVIARRVPAAILEGVYGIRFPAPSALGLLDVASTTKAGYVSAVTLLETHARARGFMTDHDRPDVSRSARLLLKQYVSGRVLFAHAPPPAAADEGQAGIGPDVHARKGMLVRAREEAAAAAAAAPDADGAGNGDGADLTAGGDDDLESVMSAAVSSSAMGAGAPARVARGSATTGEAVASAARVQRGKKHPHKSFTRVERSYYPDPQG